MATLLTLTYSQPTKTLAPGEVLIKEGDPGGDLYVLESGALSVERNGVKYAGTHLLVEVWGAKNLGDSALTEAALREGATTAGATILHCHLHHFGPNAGLSGVLVLAESHISIHTWPEREYAAIDIFMCGVCDPYLAIPAIKRAFEPTSVQIVESRRGVMA